MAEIGSKRSGPAVNFNSKIARPDDFMLLRLLVHGRHCPAVIGKAAENIKRLKKTYMVKIDGLRSHAINRVMSIEGKTKDCLSCLQEIMATCTNGPYAADNLRTMNREVNLLINSDCVGSIIGKGGSQLKSITDESKGHLKAYPGTLPNSNERVVAIGGDTEEMIIVAVQLILEVLVKFPARVPTFYYKPEGGLEDQVQMASAMNQMGLKNPMGPMGMRGMPNQMGNNMAMINNPQMRMGMRGGMPNQMGVNNMPMMNNSQMQNSQMRNPMQNPQMQKNPQMQNPQMQSPQMQNPQMQNPLMQNPHMQNPQMQKNPQMQNPQMQNPRMQNLQNQNQQMQMNQMQNNQMQNNQMQNNQMQNQKSRGKSSIASILMKDRDEYVGPKFNVNDNQPLDFQQVQTKTELTVPNDMASSIIGIKGTNIKMVCDLSGARVDSKNSKGDRTITITGTQEQVQIAEQLMLNCARSGSQSVML